MLMAVFPPELLNQMVNATFLWRRYSNGTPPIDGVFRDYLAFVAVLILIYS
ncbi:hypothetical protein SOVF_108420 [Spinacia oleracea]|nr:hypothetical protein SOVF_108420 [Spinacia oleracea]